MILVERRIFSERLLIVCAHIEGSLSTLATITRTRWRLPRVASVSLALGPLDGRRSHGLSQSVRRVADRIEFVARLSFHSSFHRLRDVSFEGLTAADLN